MEFLRALLANAFWHQVRAWWASVTRDRDDILTSRWSPCHAEKNGFWIVSLAPIFSKLRVFEICLYISQYNNILHWIIKRKRKNGIIPLILVGSRWNKVHIACLAKGLKSVWSNAFPDRSIYYLPKIFDFGKYVGRYGMSVCLSVCLFVVSLISLR